MKRKLLLTLSISLSLLGGCRLFHQHELVHHDELAATCNAEGHSAYDTCADAECNYITEYDIYPATGHTLTSYEEKPATCLENGHSAYEQCKVCSETFGYEEYPATGHNLMHYWKKEATREEPGHTNYSVCTNCGYTNGYEELPYLYTLEELLPPFEERPYIASLLKEEKEFVKELYDAIMDFDISYAIPRGISSKQLGDYMALIHHSSPEIIHLAWNYNYNYFGEDFVYLITFDYIMEKDDYPAAADAVARQVLSVVGQTDGMSEYETEVFLHDYLIDLCSYNKETTHAGNVYGAFVENKIKCDGYAKAFMLLLSAAGIECHCVAGITGDEGHAWNIVKINDSYYYVDITWDDGETGLAHYCFFNLDLASMQRSGHELSDFYAERVPECNSRKLTFPYQNGTYISEDQDTYEQLRKIIDAFVQRGDWNLYIMTETKEQYQTVIDNLDSVLTASGKKRNKTFYYNVLADEYSYYLAIRITRFFK